MASAVVRLADRVLRPTPETKRTEVARESYLTWTYSIPGYEKLLTSAGFSHLQVYWCYPSYNLPRFSGRLDDATSLKEFSSWILRRGGQDLTMHKRFLATILAKSPKVLSQLLSLLFWPNVLLFAFKNRVPDSLPGLGPLRSGVRMSGADRLDASVSFLHLSKGEILSLLRVPRYLDSNIEANEGAIRIGSRFLSLRGENLERGRAFRKHSSSDNKSLLRWLRDFQARPPMTTADSGFLERELRGLFDAAEYALLPAELQRSLLDETSALIRDSLGRKMRVVPEHGDLWTANLLVLASGDVRAIDWEFYRPQGLDTFDFLFFTITAMAIGSDPISSFWENLRGHGPYSKIASDNIRAFCADEGLTPTDLGRWVPYVLLRCIVRHSPLATNWSESYAVFRAILESWFRRDHGILR